jgi:hypothetical protein
MFKSDSFFETTFTRRTAFVGAPGLSNYFEDDQKIGFEVQSLTGTEYARALEEVRNIAARKRTIAAAKKGGADALAVALEEQFGIGDDGAADEETGRTVLRLCLWEAGIVDKSAADRRVGAKVHKHFPSDFIRVTDKILELTEEGSVSNLGE